MFVELHLLQSFAPSNLNRDDTGAPKDCEFGGCRRARVSSQCIKRAVRGTFTRGDLVAPESLGLRTRRLADVVGTRLEGQGRDAAQARAVARAALASAGFGVSPDGESEYLLFVGQGEVGRLVDLCSTHWDSLAQAGDREDEPEPDAAPRRRARKGVTSVPAEVGDQVRDLLQGTSAADVALFGRMLADLPTRNIDAACQVAHAISTHAVDLEFDFFTAVDDWVEAAEETGAGMMGTVEFNAACYYRYANVDLGQLVENLRGDHGLAGRALEAFLRAGITAVPSGKQNSMAAQNKPSFIFAVVRDAELWSLANAFLKPVRADGEVDLVEASIARLDGHWRGLAELYGTAGVRGGWVATLHPERLQSLASWRTANVEALIAGTVQAAGEAFQP